MGLIPSPFAWRMKLSASGSWPAQRITSGVTDLVSESSEEKSGALSRNCLSSTVSKPLSLSSLRVPLATETSKESSAAISATVFGFGSSFFIIWMVLSK